MAQADPYQELAAAIRELVERRPPAGVDLVERAMVIALVDKRVQDAIVAHLERGDVFIGASHLARDSAQERVAVVLEFRALPPRIAFVPPLLAIRVNVESGQVETIVDPYRGQPMGAAGAPAGAFFPPGAPP